MKSTSGLAVAAGIAGVLATSAALHAQQEKAKAAVPPRDAPAGVTTEVVKVRPAEAVKKAVVQGQMVIKRQIAAPAVFVDAMVENRDTLVERYTQQFRPLLRAELQLVRSACAPTDEQIRGVARDGEQALKATAEEFAEFQKHMS